jgi:hypothetical protein
MAPPAAPSSSAASSAAEKLVSMRACCTEREKKRDGRKTRSRESLFFALASVTSSFSLSVCPSLSHSSKPKHRPTSSAAPTPSHPRPRLSSRRCGRTSRG